MCVLEDVTAVGRRHKDLRAGALADLRNSVVAGVWGQRVEAGAGLSVAYRSGRGTGPINPVLGQIRDNWTLRIWCGSDRCTTLLAF